jgi:hypothetical protein
VTKSSKGNTIETDVKELKKENMSLREALLEIKTRSMRGKTIQYLLVS